MTTYDELYKKHTQVIRKLTTARHRLESSKDNPKLLREVKQLELDKNALQRVLRMFQ